MANDEIKINITPAMNESEFNKVKKQIEQLQKLAAASTDSNLKSGVSKVTSTSSKAEKAFQAGDIKSYNKAIIEIYKNFIELTSKISAGSTELGKSLQKLSQTFIDKSKELETASKNLAKRQTAFKSNPEIAAYKNLADSYKIGFTGKGNRQGFVKSEGGLIQTLVANQLSNKQSIASFNQAQGLNVDLDKNASFQKQAEDVAKAFTDKLVKEYEAQLQEQAKTIESLTKTIASNVAKQNKAIDELKISNPQDAAVLNGLQSTLGGAVGFSAGKASEGAAAGGIEGAAEATKDLSDAQNQLATSNVKVEGSFKKSILGVTAYGLAVRQLRRWISQAIKTITEIDQALTTQAMVSGKTRKETYELLSSYQDLAKQCGATTTEVAKVATAYFRQGKSAEEAMTLTKTAVTAAKVAGISTADSVDYLTTAVNGFNLAAKDAMQVSDKFAALAASAAVSYDELATALSKVASQANLAGMSMDYTLALLTKGIETTRESAESIGTALKTVLARMREITDYGATLEDGVDLNNVEKQLAYVNIDLRNSSGELRSTEEVLDELGRKWDTLNANQQASIAKALAGTRQQSRLIAMMTDYQRTTELAVIAQQSLGATEAQAAEYLQGMEAATNKVTTAYQQLITTVTNSEVIISIVEKISKLLEDISILLNNDAFVFTAIGGLVVIGANILVNLIAQKKEAIEIARQEKIKNLEAQKTQLYKKGEQQADAKILRLQMAEAKVQQAATKVQAIKLKYAMLQAKVASGEKVSEAEFAALKTEQVAAEQELTAAQGEYTEALAAAGTEAQNLFNSIDKSSSLLGSTWDSFKNSLTTAFPLLSGIVTLFKAIPGLINKATIAKQKENATTEAGIAAEETKALAESAGSVAANPFWGWAVALAILAAIGIAIGVTAGIAIGKAKQGQKEQEQARENVQALTQDIYNLNKSAQTIDNLANKFESLSDKVIKTQEDIDELADTLEKLKEEGFSDADIAKIENASSTAEAVAYITAAADKKRSVAAIAAQTRIIEAEKLGAEGQAEVKSYYAAAMKQDLQRAASSIVDTDNKAAFNRLVSNLNTNSFDTGLLKDNQTNAFINALGDSKNDRTRKEWQNALSSYASFQGQDRKFFKKIDTALDNKDFAALSTLLNDQQLTDLFTELGVDTATVFGDLATNLVGKVDFKKLNTVLDTSTTDWSNYIKDWNIISSQAKEAGISLAGTFPEIQAAINLLGKSEALQNAGWTIEQITKLSEIKGLNLEDVAAAQANGYSKAFIGTLNNAETAQKVLDILFPTLGERDANLKNLKKARDSVIDTMDKYLSGDVTGSELADTLTSAGIGSAEVLAEAYAGNFSAVYRELAKVNKTEDEALKADINNNINALRQLINLTADEDKIAEYNKEIAILESQIKAVDKLNEVSFQEVIKKEKEYQDSRLEIIKEAIQKENDLRKEQLENLKDAYQEYFDEIDKEAEATDYEEARARIMANMSALGASTDAASLKALAELEQELTELDKERMETLRQEGRDALLSNIDDEVTRIDENLEKLLENNEELLNRYYKSDINSALTSLYSSINAGENTDWDILSNWNSIASGLGLDSSGLGLLSAVTGRDNVAQIESKGNNTFVLTLADGSTTQLTVSDEDNRILTSLLNNVLTSNGFAGTNKN